MKKTALTKIFGLVSLTAVLFLIAYTPANSTMPGARFPSPWDVEFKEPPEYMIGKEAEITITITSTLFDMEDVELIPTAKDSLQLVSGKKWKGDLKKGKPHAVTFIVKPTVTGFNGYYGVKAITPNYYDEFADYVRDNFNNPARESLLYQLEGMESSEPENSEWFGTSIEIGPTGKTSTSNTTPADSGPLLTD